MKPINVLHLSTHDEECGIAIYQQNIVNGMGQTRAINNVFFHISPNKLKLLKGQELQAALHELFTQLKDFDILHIQHEYSFYYGNQLQLVVDGAARMHKKILFTMHTPPHALGRHMPTVIAPGLHPRSWIAAYRSRKARQLFLDAHITPLQKADLVVVPSRSAKNSFASFGVPAERMRVIELPVPTINTERSSKVLQKALDKKPGDVLLSTVGFIAKTKGIIAAVKSLTYLPDNYKLAIIGGAHPSGQNDEFIDEVCDVIRELDLQKRVYITGYVADDDERDAMARETDICLYPYDREYYNYVSSAALTNAIANGLPIVAYKTDTFLEANDAVPFINFCQSANYYQLARVIRALDTEKSVALTKQYADKFSVETQAAKIAECYKELAEQSK